MVNLDDPRFRLNSLLTRYEALTAPKQSAPPLAQAQLEAIVESFNQLAFNVIRPAMEDIGAELRRRGLDYEIVIARGQQIIMYLYPSPPPRSAYTASCCPYVSFSSDALTAKIHIVQSTLMPNGHGSAEITDTLSAGQITRHFVETQILNVLENVLGTAGR